jgi:hypothetical protein
VPVQCQVGAETLVGLPDDTHYPLGLFALLDGQLSDELQDQTVFVAEVVGDRGLRDSGLGRDCLNRELVQTA